MKSYKSITRGTFVLSIIILLLVALPASTALADTAGPNDAGAGANVSDIGTRPWSAPENIMFPGGEPYATAVLKKGNLISNYLQGTQYGFSIPSDATIFGIAVVINRQSSANNPSILDNFVRLVKGGVVVGDNHAITTIWPNLMGTATYGGATDLWGTTWTPADINSPDFGVVLSARRQNNGNSDRTAMVDYMQITIYYSFETSTTVTCGGGIPEVTYGDSLNCVASVTHITDTNTPTGTASWTTDGSGTFDPNPCNLTEVAVGTATCSISYTPSAVGSGFHNITATYSGDSYFSPSSSNKIIDVLKRPVSVTADPQTKVYSDPDPEFSYQITEGSLVFSDTFTGTLSREPGENVGPYPILQGTLVLTDNYDLSYVGDDLTITKADPTCVVTPYTLEYDRNEHTATGTCSGVKGEALLGLDLTGTAHTDIGTYVDDPWTFTDVTGNYNNDNGTVNDAITLRFITVTADPKSKVVGQPDPALTYRVTVGSLLSGDAFSGELIRESGEVIGTYAILQGTLSLPDYYDITYVDANFTITGGKIFIPLVFR
jgi:hypothetical protein